MDSATKKRGYWSPKRLRTTALVYRAPRDFAQPYGYQVASPNSPFAKFTRRFDKDGSTNSRRQFDTFASLFAKDNSPHVYVCVSLASDSIQRRYHYTDKAKGVVFYCNLGITEQQQDQTTNGCLLTIIEMGTPWNSLRDRKGSPDPTLRTSDINYIE